MRKQFDSCSYAELTSCIKARIEWIRESRQFLRDKNTEVYRHTRATVRLTLLRNKLEIRNLLKMRRVLKRSGLKNWDSDKLAI